jgi:diguanylate cyclase (GGDEF)-like protein
MQLSKMLLENFTTICLSIGLGIIIIKNKNYDQKTNTSFAAFVLIIIALVAAGMVDQWCSFQPKPSVLRYIASSLGYVLRPASVAILVNILLRRKKIGFSMWIPLICIAAVSFTSAFTHLMFWFNETNCFMRGPLWLLPHIGGLIYIFMLLVLIFKKHRYITTSEVFTVLFSSLICVAATVLETVLSDYHFLLTGAMAVSCVLYYVVLYAETFKVDQLTGLLNRRSLYTDVEGMKNKPFSVISVDLNCLKDINDSQGHHAGDHALKSLADVLAANGGKDYCPYRVGGDEFIVLGKELDDGAIGRFIDALRADLEKQNLMASFGYALFHSGDHFDDICNKADAQMYADKRRYKYRRASN